MNEPIDPPLTAIPDAGGPTSPGPWPVNPMPSPANDAPSRPGYPLGAPVWTPGAPVWTPATPGAPGAPGGFPVRPTDARTAWAVPGPNPATVSSLPTVLTPTSIAEPLTGVVPAGPPARRSRTADVALLLAAFVATAGVAFAIGRLSASEIGNRRAWSDGIPQAEGRRSPSRARRCPLRRGRGRCSGDVQLTCCRRPACRRRCYGRRCHGRPCRRRSPVGHDRRDDGWQGHGGWPASG